MKIDGKSVAETIYGKLRATTAPDKFLAGILCGEDPASRSFLDQKKKAAEKLKIDFRIFELPSDISNDEARREVGRISSQGACGGAILQLPLPGQLNAQYVLNAIPPEKDVDVLGERSFGTFCAGRGKISPPAAGVVEEILKKFPLDLSQSVVAIVGAGRLVGKPAALWALGNAKEIIVLDKGSDLGELKKADLIISGAGSPGIIKGEMLKNEAGIIDFGYGKNEKSNLAGDLDINSDLDHLGFYTPTPGGTGPILVAKLLENFYKLN